MPKSKSEQTEFQVGRGVANGRKDVPNKIVTFAHCGRCLQELPKGESPRSFASLEVGMTPTGVQVWCKRHELNVVDITLEKFK